MHCSQNVWRHDRHFGLRYESRQILHTRNSSWISCARRTPPPPVAIAAAMVARPAPGPGPALGESPPETLPTSPDEFYAHTQSPSSKYIILLRCTRSQTSYSRDRRCYFSISSTLPNPNRKRHPWSVPTFSRFYQISFICDCFVQPNMLVAIDCPALTKAPYCTANRITATNYS